MAATCHWCEQEMKLGVSCSVATFTDLGPTPLPRIPYGDEREGWQKLNFTPPPNCHDCNAPVGGLHHVGCTKPVLQLGMQSVGLCKCGCGQPAPLAHQTDTKRGYVKGQPRDFIAGHRVHKPPEARFWEKVDKQGGDDACWTWTAALYTNEYGHFTISKTEHVLAHRYAYLLANGTIDPALKVLHSCDNPSCVNPNHLSQGTQRQNMADMHERQRGRKNYVRGEKAPSAKLSAEQAQEIRERYGEGGVSYAQLAAEFGVAKTTIGALIRGRTW